MKTNNTQKATVANPYSRAIFEVAKENNKIEEYKNILYSLSLVALDQEIKQAFLSLSKENFTTAVCDVIKAQADKYIVNFVKILIFNGRWGLLSEIYQQFLECCLCDENAKIVNITSAFALSGAALVQIKEILETKLKARLVINHKEDSSLITGCVIKFDDTVLDLSLLGYINSFKNSLLS